MFTPAPPDRPTLPVTPRWARVVVVLPSGDDLGRVLLECLRRELVAVPMDPRSEPAAIAELVDRVDAALLVTRGDDGIEVAVTDRHRDRADAVGLALIMFTSGSTGRPKGVMLPRDAVCSNARLTAGLHRFGPDRPHATCLPLFHCNALVMSLIGCHLTGTPLLLHGRFDPEAYLADIDRHGVRTASIVPALLPDLLDAAPPWPEGLDYLITAAAPLTPEVADRFHRTYGPRLRQGYGLTELVNFSCTTPVLDEDAWRDAYLDHHPPVGAPLPGTEVRVVDEEVQIRSADRMRGYWDDPDTTAAALTSQGWLRTGDLGHVRDGLVVLSGRRSERIDRGGEKFYPLEVEQRWAAAGLVGRIAAVPVPDDVLNHEVGLVVDMTAGREAPALDDLAAIVDHGPVRPATLALGGFRATATGKPQRTAMGRGLAAGRVPRTRRDALRSALADGSALDRTDHDALADLVVKRLDDTGVGPIDRIDAIDALDALDDHEVGLDTVGAVVVTHGPRTDRWALLARLRAGRDVVGTAILRAGDADAGGVVWAH